MENEELYEQILMEKGILSKAKTDFYHSEEKTNFELTYQQKSIWFLQQMNPTSPLYNNPSAVLLKGKLNLEKLKEAFSKIVERQRELNVGFTVENGTAYQYIRKVLFFEFEAADYGEKNGAYSVESLKQYINTIAKRTFNLFEDPVLRVTVIKLGDTEHVMVINIHHIVSDGWSKGILLGELASIYGELMDNAPEKLKKQELQYYDYVRWINRKTDSVEWKEQITFWQEKLKSAPALLELPADYERPSIQSNKGSIIGFSFQKDELDEIDDFCKKHKITLFVFLLSALKILLYKYSGQGDLVIGTPVAGRNNSKLEGIIGLFVNTVLIRTSIKDDMSFCEYLDTVKNEAYDAFARQEVPFDLLVTKLNPKRELSYNPLFQVMFQLDNAPVPRLKMGDLELNPMVVDIGISQLDLSVTCWKEGNILNGTFEYNTELFKSSRIERMTAHYRKIVKTVLKNPLECISLIDYLEDEEREKLIYQWNETDYEIEDMPVVEMFESQVAKLPDNTAVIFNDEKITYRELDRKACAIRDYLISNNLGNTRFMAICMGNSIELVATVLAALKCGSAFVPIDPTYPEKRIKTMIEDLKDTVVLTDKEYENLLSGCDAEIVVIEKALKEKAHSAETVNNPRNYADTTCCCIFTSGSTGKPKGVLIDNRSVLNLIHSFILSYKVEINDKMLPITSISSASFVGEMLPILSAGGTLVLSNTEKYMDVQKLSEFINENSITILSTVPSMIAGLNTINKFPESIRLILSGGETLFPNHIDRLKNVQIVNGYGLTESGICSTYKVIDQDDLEKGHLPVGRPIINNYVYVLDKNLEPVPIGTKGEIYISGIGIARGYLHNDEMTKERFIDNPFSKGYKMLKTGDVGYWLENGDLQFIGRTDNQVQVHGYRVELGEIQKELLKHKDINDVVVITKATEHDDAILVAYCTTANGASLKSSELSEWLAQRKPRYMVPRFFVMVDSMPLNKNGKVDIAALNKLDNIRRNDITEYETAQTETEKVIVTAWREYLEISEVGIYDNFFDVGGHSLLMSKVLNRLKETLSVDLSIVDLFKYPTINSLGKYIDSNKQVSFKSTEDRALKQRQAFARQRKETPMK
jgi:amino acid adenylation domain-containing protein